MYAYLSMNVKVLSSFIYSKTCIYTVKKGEGSRTSSPTGKVHDSLVPTSTARASLHDPVACQGGTTPWRDLAIRSGRTIDMERDMKINV